MNIIKFLSGSYVRFVYYNFIPFNTRHFFRLYYCHDASVNTQKLFLKILKHKTFASNKIITTIKLSTVVKPRSSQIFVKTILPKRYKFPNRKPSFFILLRRDSHEFEEKWVRYSPVREANKETHVAFATNQERFERTKQLVRKRMREEGSRKVLERVFAREMERKLGLDGIEAPSYRNKGDT